MVWMFILSLGSCIWTLDPSRWCSFGEAEWAWPCWTKITSRFPRPLLPFCDWHLHLWNPKPKKHFLLWVALVVVLGSFPHSNREVPKINFIVCVWGGGEMWFGSIFKSQKSLYKNKERFLASLKSTDFSTQVPRCTFMKFIYCFWKTIMLLRRRLQRPTVRSKLNPISPNSNTHTI